jgi:phosphotransferase system IIB component
MSAVKFDSRASAQEIYEIVAPSGILNSTHCTTRLRVTINDKKLIDIEKLRKVNGVVGVIFSSNELQVVFSPSRIKDVSNHFDEIRKNTIPNESTPPQQSTEIKSLNQIASENKDKLRKNYSGFQDFFSKFSKVFAPLIPAFIGAGLIAGIAGIENKPTVKKNINLVRIVLI